MDWRGLLLALSRTLSSLPPPTHHIFSLRIDRHTAVLNSLVIYRFIMKKLLLRNREVFATVIEFVLDTPNGRRSVSRLARTCRALYEPCLNALWKELDSLLPLLSLLPNDLYKRPRRPGLGFVSETGCSCTLLSMLLCRQRTHHRATGSACCYTGNVFRRSPTMKL